MKRINFRTIIFTALQYLTAIAGILCLLATESRTAMVVLPFAIPAVCVLLQYVQEHKLVIKWEDAEA